MSYMDLGASVFTPSEVSNPFQPLAVIVTRCLWAARGWPIDPAQVPVVQQNSHTNSRISVYAHLQGKRKINRPIRPCMCVGSFHH